VLFIRFTYLLFCLIMFGSIFCKSSNAEIWCRFCRYLLQQVGEWQVSFRVVAWSARCNHCCVHGAAVLWRSESSVSTDGTSLLPSDLTETAACHVGTAAVQSCSSIAGIRHAQQLVHGQCNWHFVVHVCCLSIDDADNAS